MYIKRKEELLSVKDNIVFYIRQNQVIAKAPLYDCMLFYHQKIKQDEFCVGMYIPGYYELVEFYCPIDQEKKYKKIIHEMKGSCAIVEADKEQAEGLIKNRKKENGTSGNCIQLKEQMMFLNLLNDEESQKYLELTAVIEDVNKENEGAFKALVEYFSEKTMTIKKSVLFELYLLLLKDEKIADEEKTVIKTIISEFDIPKKKAKDIKQLAIDLKLQQEKVLEALL